ncbi:MAG TPA: hypothetical protein VNS12_13450 [Pelagibacterium sp.]|uniref:hypothetical protein n=1 Tax=Pelagibacterium sp. TaxID=1967288 RepID=UPI002BB19423|nr:hypothetical protein [Pelagibacterium sp.]HWJ89068.1 hypothetical protein [Pelagibacterium sp.]
MSATNPARQGQLVLKDADLRDYLALTASDDELFRFRDFQVPPIGGPRRAKYTIEQARYRFADAMLAARAS